MDVSKVNNIDNPLTNYSLKSSIQHNHIVHFCEQKHEDYM